MLGGRRHFWLECRIAALLDSSAMFDYLLKRSEIET